MTPSASVFSRKTDWGVDIGDAREWGWSLPKNSINCVITSPPYYGLRAYLPEGHAGADTEIGREQTPDEYVENLVELFRGIRRALHPTGCVWLNLGDSFSNDDKWGGRTGGKHAAGLHGEPVGRARRFTGCKPKDLLGIPWKVAFALRDDGWYLRQHCPWVKRNPMPESVLDRPSTACEEIFLLAKSPDYFFDMQAVRKPVAPASFDHRPTTRGLRGAKGISRAVDGACGFDPEGRNFRNSDLWFDSVGMLFAGDVDGTNDETVLGIDCNTQPYKGSHFAVMPKRLILPMMLAGTSEKGVCPHCGSPWVRQTEKERVPTRTAPPDSKDLGTMVSGNRDSERHITRTKTVAWEPSCECPDNTPIPCIVGDPFAGSGTVLAVARDRGRRAVGCELNENYTKLIQRRVGGVDPSLI